MSNSQEQQRAVKLGVDQSVGKSTDLPPPAVACRAFEGLPSTRKRPHEGSRIPHGLRESKTQLLTLLLVVLGGLGSFSPSRRMKAEPQLLGLESLLNGVHCLVEVNRLYDSVPDLLQAALHLSAPDLIP